MTGAGGWSRRYDTMGGEDRPRSDVNFSDYERLLFDRRDHGVLVITMNRPDKYNATDAQMHGELARVWTEVSADPETRVAVVTGAGRRSRPGET